jgi:ABC-type transport system substrate-binding protein
MKRIALTLIAAVASVVCVAALKGATRPHYGGALRVSMRAAPMSLDPADPNQAQSTVVRNLAELIFDTLTTLDFRGLPQPALAASWQAEPGNQRWRFYIRPGVTFQDGAPVSPDAVAASLRAVNAKWKIFPAEESVVIECEAPTPDLPAQLALERYSIARRGGKLAGSGPFVVVSWNPGKRLTLLARDEYWGGRAFVDSIEVEMGRNLREQTIALNLGKADVIEITPEEVRRAVTEGHLVKSSVPAEFMGLLFAREQVSADELRLRQALAFSIDRATMNNVLLQGGGEPAGGILPNWMTGYAFLFPAQADLPHARQLRGEVHEASSWTLAYDPSDALARVIAERIILSAHDSGMVLQLATNRAADIRLVRFPLASLDPQIALTEAAATLGLPPPKFNRDSADRTYAAEKALLQSERVIPLFHLREAIEASSNVQGLTEDRDGRWKFQNVWLGTIPSGTENP